MHKCMEHTEEPMYMTYLQHYRIAMHKAVDQIFAISTYHLPVTST